MAALGIVHFSRILLYSDPGTDTGAEPFPTLNMTRTQKEVPDIIAELDRKGSSPSKRSTLGDTICKASHHPETSIP